MTTQVDRQTAKELEDLDAMRGRSETFYPTRPQGLICYACGFKGPGVRYESVHIGGQGEVLKPRCFDLDKCDARREICPPSK